MDENSGSCSNFIFNFRTSALLSSKIRSIGIMNLKKKNLNTLPFLTLTVKPLDAFISLQDYFDQF